MSVEESIEEELCRLQAPDIQLPILQCSYVAGYALWGEQKNVIRSSEQTEKIEVNEGRRLEKSGRDELGR